MSTELSRNDLYGYDSREEDRRRVSSHEDKSTYDIRNFWQRHHEIVNLASRGFKQTEIAEILGITPQTVSNTLNSTLGEQKLSEVRKERDEDAIITRERIRVLKDQALKVYQDLFDNVDGSASIRERLHAADVVTLELAGMKAPTKIQSSSVTLTGEELLALKERGLKALKDSGFTVNIESEEVNNESINS